MLPRPSGWVWCLIPVMLMLLETKEMTIDGRALGFLSAAPVMDSLFQKDFVKENDDVTQQLVTLLP